MTVSTRTVRLFISSTFSDMVQEREVLQKHVFGRLRDLCRARGARFQAIDLRWGVNRSLRHASCCKVLVMNGAAGVCLAVRVRTWSTI